MTNILKINQLLASCAFAASQTVFGATTLSVGDVSIIGYSSDGVDEVSFITWVDLDSDTQISFTDRGWRSGANEFTKNPSDNPATPGLSPGDGNLTWSPNVPVVAGSIITATFANNNPDTATWSLGLSNGDFGHSGLTSGGESIFAYQGTASSPNLIFGLYFDDTTWSSSDPGEYSLGPSQLPFALNTAIGNIVVPVDSTNDNAFYSGSFNDQSNLLDYRSSVLDNSNWTISNTDDITNDNLHGVFPSGGFETIPEPSTALLLGLCGVASLRRRRK
ncbi:PEP-CTERM sorting domain-containing protein [Roseibacillus persicicus]|uniref:PEP-CTERM sorting domain-containing protein n=1 Tax=Roseibacillus persicicus TaxID=454148 RepID=UPI00398B617D